MRISAVDFHKAVLTLAIASLAPPGIAGAATVPYTEDFNTDAAGWYDSAGISLVSWNAIGGPDGGSFVSTMFNFAGSAPTDTPPLFRGHDTFNSSNDAFVGDWIAAGVTEFHAWIRHDADVPLTFFSRFAPSFGPGAVALGPVAVPGGVWRELEVSIEPDTFIYEGPVTFESLFHSVGNLQIGAMAQPLAGVDHAVTFGLDKVAIVPEPGSLAIFTIGAMVLILGRRSPKGGTA